MQQQHEMLVGTSQGRMYAIAEHLQNPISTRYDDIYHPRTDKRVIRKLFKSYFFIVSYKIIGGN